MKIKKLKLNNFAQFTDFEVEYKDNVTHLVGVNGSGKSTVGLTAIWAGLKGIAENDRGGNLIGERFRFIGSSKPSSDIEITLVDGDAEIKVKNHITKQSNQITFEAPDNYPITDGWLNELFSAAFLSEKHFTGLSSQQQAILLGIDTSEYDSQIKELKSEYTLVNRDLKNLGEVKEVEKAESVSVSDLIAERDKMQKFNSDQDKKGNEVKRAKDRLADLQEEEKELLRQLEEVRQHISTGNDYLKKLPKPEDQKDLSQINEKIATVEKTNQAASDYKAYVEKKTKRDKLKKELDTNKEKQSLKEKERLGYIQTFDFGFDGLNVDEEGGLMLSGRPIKEPYFSKGEREMIVALLYASLNPKLKVRFIDDFNNLDEDNQKKLLDQLLEKDFQVITAEVKTDNKDNVVYLRECKIDDGKQKEKLF